MAAAKKTNPFEFDISKLMGGFDASKMMEGFDASKMMGGDIGKTMGGLKPPQVDMDAMMVSQRKNAEALTAANQCTLEGISTLMQRQSEIAKTMVESYSNAMRELMGAGSAEEKASRQVEFVKQAYEAAFQNLRELGDLATKTRDEAFTAVNRRVTDSLDEIKTAAETGVAAPTDKK
ncbi:MAG: phasin family protein [Alphaproteobacteria bacterium]|nr:phasin family protein [Alphaproteobacteria bacterium]